MVGGGQQTRSQCRSLNVAAAWTGDKRQRAASSAQHAGRPPRRAARRKAREPPCGALGCTLRRSAPRFVAAYFAAIKATVVSSMRLENPHSLSYQLSTLTSLPSAETRVCVASKVLEAGSWLKSTLTSGLVL